MKYQVNASGGTRDSEFEQLVSILSEMGLSERRDDKGRIGVVASKATAEAILARIRTLCPSGNWFIAEVDD